MTTQRLSSRSEPATQTRSFYSSPARAWTLLLLVFFAVHFVALFSPSLLDDADATHAQAAQHMAHTGDWVTLNQVLGDFAEHKTVAYSTFRSREPDAARRLVLHLSSAANQELLRGLFGSACWVQSCWTC